MNQETSGKINIKNICLCLAIPGLLASTILTITGCLGQVHRYFELTSHFKVKYLIINFIVLILLLVARRKSWLFVCLFCLTINGFEVLPWYGVNIANKTSEVHLKILLANVHTKNQRYSEFISLVKQERPDVVVVEEIDKIGTTELAAIHALFPYRFLKPRFDNFGIGIYSYIPLDNLEVKSVGEYDIPTLIADIKLQEHVVSLIATHPLPPVSQEYFYWRNQQLAEISDRVQQLKNKPVIVVGDLNTTMWSPYYRKFIRDSGLKNGRSGFGVQPTWPVDAPIFSIPLDYCLVSPEIKVIDSRVGKDIGSDHYPLITELDYAIGNCS
ncbi:MAG: endonuclease/exonuclease/phosphatase family protein [Hormoscilla sp. SP12CHS1]|nr:endonuclease/exonuclease/phosphatase family protein [Hormoscilla sp. SP12CHS1]